MREPQTFNPGRPTGATRPDVEWVKRQVQRSSSFVRDLIGRGFRRHMTNPDCQHEQGQKDG